MYLSTVALCTWHCDKLVLRTCTFPTYSKFLVFINCLPCVPLFLCESCKVPSAQLTSTALKRCSSSYSGGIGSFADGFWEPVDPGGADTALPSFPWGTSMLPAAFPMIVNVIYPRKYTYKKKRLPNITLNLVCQSYMWGSVWPVTFCYFHDHRLLVDPIK